MEIVQIPVLNDNYVYLVRHGDETVVVDPAAAEPVLAEAQRRDWPITAIWNTHWHGDHTGGNLAIKEATGCAVIGPAAEREKIPGIDRAVKEGDHVRLGGLQVDVLDVPGHTAGHVAYYLPAVQALFVGDTLFAMGCGRLFEGTAEQMWGNMVKLAALPDATRVYCAHEYTRSNGLYARVAEPDNAAIKARMADVEAACAKGEPTIPTTIALERATNPFMRAGSAEELAVRRAAKDVFRG